MTRTSHPTVGWKFGSIFTQGRWGGRGAAVDFIAWRSNHSPTSTVQPGCAPVRKAFALSLVVALLASLMAAWAPEAQAATRVGIRGENFRINGKLTYRGTAVRGMLLNSRMVQAIFHDENSDTRHNWRYSDTNKWQPKRNVREFINMLPRYRRRGKRAVTIGLQGGMPKRTVNGPNITSAFKPGGALKRPWMKRLRRVLRAANKAGMVVIVQCFYQAQARRLRSEAAVRRGVRNVVDWLTNTRFRNVLLEIANETSNQEPFFREHEILQPARIHELIRLAKQRSARRGRRLFVSASMAGGEMTPANMRRVVDFFLPHGNGQNPSQVRAMVRDLRATQEFRNKPRPIVFNEDSVSVANMDAALGEGASWGYYDQGDNNYVDGFQSPPVNWRINTSAKRAFFRRMGAWIDTGPGQTPARNAV